MKLVNDLAEFDKQRKRLERCLHDTLVSPTCLMYMVAYAGTFLRNKIWKSPSSSLKNWEEGQG